MTVFAWSNAAASRVREQLAGWRARHADLEQWNSAQTLAELGQVTARWLRGELDYNWAYNGRPDEETDQIAAPLAAVNQAGYVTTGSQPGLQEGVWSQRAAVEGLADDATRDRLQAIAERHGLRFQAHKAGWRMDYSTATNVTKTTDPEGNVWEHTGFGSTISRNHLCNLLLGHCPDVHNEACDAWQVTIIDPEWGRNERFVAALDEFSGRQVPGKPAQEATPQPQLATPHAQLSGTQSGSAMTLDLPTLNADTATGHTLAKSLREVAEAARRGAAEATARAEALRAQAAAMDDKPDLKDAAAGLLAEAAMWEEKAQSRLGTAAAYEDAAQAAETEEGK